MEYIKLSDLGLEESKGMFLGYSSSKSLEELAEELLASEFTVNDMDNSAADCLATKLPFYDLATIRLLNPSFWLWGIKSALGLGVEKLRKKVGFQIEEPWENRAWKDYFEKFLDDEKTLVELEVLATEKTPDLIYPGVKEFYSMKQEVPHALVTRNIIQMTRPFADIIGFDILIVDAFDKAEAIDFVVNSYKPFDKHIFIGDYTTFVSAYNLLVENRERATNILVSSGKRISSDIFSLVDLHVGQNYYPLINLMQKYEQK